MSKRLLGLFLGVLSAVGFLSAQTYENSLDAIKLIPEAIWAASAGGGTWQTEVQITASSDNTEINGTFYYGGGDCRPVDYGVTLDQRQIFKASNILSYMETIDTSFDYYNRVGTLILFAQDSLHNFQANACTWHSSGYAKSFNGINNVMGQAINSTLTTGAILNLSKDSNKRSSIACYNNTNSSIVVEFSVINNNGNFIGSSFIKSFSAYDFQAFDPFTEAGLTGNYSNNFIYMIHHTGGGNLFVIGASADNNTNDPSAHTFLPWIE